jgi:hypothetical protein
MAGLYDLLAKEQKASRFKDSDEMAFFLTNRGILSGYEICAKFVSASDPFDIVRANILIRALLNKRTIERLYLAKTRPQSKNAQRQIEAVGLDLELPIEEFMASGMSELPYLLYQGRKIYVPVFPASLNVIYDERFEKLLVDPYKRMLAEFEPLMVDAFDYYGTALYDSYFTKLVAIKRKAGVLAAYDFDAECLYFINDQGRLDAKLALFDKRLRHEGRTHLVKRLERLAAAYFDGDKEDLLDSLETEGFISSDLIEEIRSDDKKIRDKAQKKRKAGTKKAI